MACILHIQKTIKNYKIHFMKKIILFAISSLLFLNASAQSFVWAKQAGKYAYDYGEGVATDAAGNVYVAGKYEQDAIFDGVVVTCEGNHDSFVAKYNSGGTVQWVRTGGGPNGDYAHALAVDAAGNIYVAGEIEGLTAVFGDTTVSGHGGGSGNDIFVAKYDTDGNLQWVTTLGGEGNDKAKGIAIDAAGNSYITGQFTDTAFFGSTVLYGDSLDDIFIAKVDPNGNPVWAIGAGGIWDDTGKGIAADASGNIFVTGYFSGTMNFGTSLTSSGYYDIFIGKWDTDGILQWIKKAGSPWYDVGWGITIDNSGNSYITGEFNADAKFGSLPTIYSTGMADIFVAKYDGSGTAMWVKQFGDTLIDRARGIATDNTNLYVTGQYGGSITFNGQTVSAVDSSDIVVASYTLGGTPRWIMASSSGDVDTLETLGYEAGNAIAVDPGGYVYPTGSFLQDEVIGSTSLNGWSRTDIFLAKISQFPVGVREIENVVASVHPNPSNGLISIDLKKANGSDLNIIISDELGRIIYNMESNSADIVNIDLSEYGKGIYFLNIYNNERNEVQKIVLY
jgi:hypothetical protein